jgi:hypothetical protein
LRDAGTFQGCFDSLATTNGFCTPVNSNTNGVIDRPDQVALSTRFDRPG